MGYRRLEVSQDLFRRFLLEGSPAVVVTNKALPDDIEIFDIVPYDGNIVDVILHSKEWNDELKDHTRQNTRVDSPEFTRIP